MLVEDTSTKTVDPVIMGQITPEHVPKMTVKVIIQYYNETKIINKRTRVLK